MRATQIQSDVKVFSQVKDPSLAPQGRLKIEWAESRMPVLLQFREEARELSLIHISEPTRPY